MGLGFDKVIAPDVIAMPWPEPDARAVVQPEPASWPMFSGYLEPLTAPDPLDAITTNPPASLDQQRGDPTIASVLRSQRIIALVSASSSVRTIVAYRCVPRGWPMIWQAGVRTDHTFPECPGQPAGAVRGLQVSRSYILQDLLFQR